VPSPVAFVIVFLRGPRCQKNAFKRTRIWLGSRFNDFWSLINLHMYFVPHPVFSSQSVSSVDLTEILLASRRAVLHDFMALSYGPARGLEYDRRGFRTWVDCDDRHGRNFCLARCNAHKRVQALPTMPRHGVNTVDAPLQELVKSRKN